ncbi:hypothetical protein VE00_08995 [Pseudogymnoascus sp. WSF 3629]|nr:hypothetical protein VE00_08995 [Pseudogymnoascus sp. WSF 3629]
MSFQTLPPELVAGILHRAPDFTSLLSMIETCKLAYEVFKSSSDIIVHAMFERTCIRILGAFSTLPKVPGKRNVSQNRKIQQEFIRKQSRPTSKTANLCKPLLGELSIAGSTLTDSTEGCCVGLIVNQDPNGPAAHHGIDVARLEEVTREAMASWFADRKKPKNAEKRGFLTQLFHVLYKEERYRCGELDGSTTVFINDLAVIVEHDDDDDEDSDPSTQQHQPAYPISPLLSRSSLSPSHPITTAAPTGMQDYYPPHLQPRSSYLPATPGIGEEYTNPACPLYNHSSFSHQQQAPTCPSRAWPAQELNVYSGSSWSTPTVAPVGSMQQFSFRMPTSSPPQ